MRGMAKKRLSRQAAEHLLYELNCMGYCLPAAGYRQILDNPPLTVDRFTDAVLRAEGLEPAAEKRLRREVKEKVATHFARSELDTD